ncbi:hypothetical protein NM688_g6335 [Phlebia brevispora]|uniref:Uncharacterized protein n=1 Tax=Phlebia brevispora TaxID=194682 RepID=A0ACC1SHF0_9APHY|nr:hypothetical protein NM688_g6335 [Phlebia brevispora]
MPSTSTLTKEEKDKIKAAVPSSSFKVQTAALARIYYAYPNPQTWSYSGIQGALAFVLDLSRNVFCLKMVDIVGTRGVVWQHELYDGFEYYEDRPYFHTFEGDECMIAIVLADSNEAKTLYKKVTSKKNAPGGGKAKATPTRKKTVKGKIDKSMISGPKDGLHVLQR